MLTIHFGIHGLSIPNPAGASAVLNLGDLDSKSDSDVYSTVQVIDIKGRE